MELNLEHHSLPIYKALASEVRLDILRYIGSGKRSIGEIAGHIGLSNAITTRHVQQMEDAGLLDSERGTGIDRNKKLVFLKVDNIHIAFPEKVYSGLNLHATDLKIGHFTDFKAAPTCGLTTVNEIVGGKLDDPRSFMDSLRVDAALLWLCDGYVEYKIPNLMESNETPELLEFSFELASEFPISQNVWPSDISFYVNGIKAANHTLPGNFSDIRGRYTPAWWDDSLSQYGVLTFLRIYKDHTAVNGHINTQINLSDLHLNDSPFISLRLAVDPDAENKGGLTIFGKGYGNYDQNILVKFYCKAK